MANRLVMSALWDVYIVCSIILLFWNIVVSERVILHAYYTNIP